MSDDFVIVSSTNKFDFAAHARSGAPCAGADESLAPLSLFPLPLSLKKRIRTFRPTASTHPTSIRILETIRSHPKKTSKQIGALLGMSRRQTARSLHSLLR